MEDAHLAGRALKKQTIIQGAIILTLASIIIRILAVGYRIPVARLLGGEGMGLYAVPNQVYFIFFTISSAGIPVAMARLISEKIAGGFYRDAYRTFKVAFMAMFIFGLLFSLLLFFGSSWLVESGLVANPDSYYGLLAISPVIFFAALTSSFRGLFQGLQNLSPVAVSQVGEQVILVAGTVFFSYLLIPRGLALAAAGANFGAVPGAAAATLIMALYYLRHRGSLLEMVDRDDTGYREKASTLLKKILAISIPVSFASVAMAITGFIDNKIIIDRLQMVGYTLKGATDQYGQINQMAMSFINISIAFAFSLGTSIVPAVADSFSANNKMNIQRKASEAIRLSLITTLPAAAGLVAIAPQLTDLFYAEKAAGIPLMVLAPSVAFWGVHLVLSGVLQGLGRADIPVINLLAGIAVRIAITYFLVPTSLGIRAAALGTVAMFLVSSTLNYLAVKRLVGLNVNIPSAVLRPGIASLLMGLAVFQFYRWGLDLLGHAYLATIAAILGGALLYPVLAMLLGAVRSDDIKGLPKIGGRAAALATAYESRRDRLLAAWRKR
jgi:stage V sporulation protein B